MSFDHVSQNPISDSDPQPQKRLDSVSEQVGFDVPVDTVKLPSKGLLYGPEHPLCGQAVVDIKCMTAKEEDLLTSRALIKNGTVFSKLIQSCLLNKSVDPESLLVGDRNALLVQIRVTGYGAEYAVRISCPECGEEFDNEFNLSRLPIKDLSVEPIQPGVNAFKFALPVTKKEVIFKLLTGADEKLISQEEEGQKKLGRTVESSVTTRLFHSILSIGDVSDRQKLRYMVQNLPARDSKKLREYINSIQPDLDMSQEAVCVHCGERSVVDVPLARNFLWPD